MPTHLDLQSKPEWEDDENTVAYKLLNKLLLNSPDGMFTLYDVRVAHFTGNEKKQYAKLQRKIEDLLIGQYAYMQAAGGYFVRLTSKGVDARDAGGHEAYVEQLKEEKAQRGKSIINNNVNIEGNNAGAINQGRDFVSLPTATPIQQANANSQNSFRSIALKALGWALSHIVQIIIAIIVGFILFKFGWN